jgi:hypothetical protein
MIEAVRSSETWPNLYRATRHYIPEAIIIFSFLVLLESEATSDSLLLLDRYELFGGGGFVLISFFGWDETKST